MKKLWEPNRIEELREERGWSRSMLVDKVEEATGQRIQVEQLGKLERRERQLTPKWMFTFAETFGVEPIDLIDLAAMAGSTDDVAPLNEGPHAEALAERGLRYYSVISDVCSESGYSKGKTLLADESADALARAKSGDLVVVEFRPGREGSLLLLRVFVAPGLLVTNKPTSNAAMKVGKNRIVAVVVRESNS